MANDLLTPTIIAKEALRILRNNLVMGTKVHRAYEGEFQKIGDSCIIRKPVKFTVTKARTRSTSDVDEQSITLQVNTQAHVSWGFITKDLTLTIEQYSKRYIEPATNVITNTIDADVLSLYKDVYNTVWESTGFVDPESFIVLGKAGRKLDEEACPQTERCVVLNPAANWSLANAMKNMYVTDVSKPALKKGYLAKIANMEIYMDQNVKVHETGQYHNTGSTPAIQLLTGGTGIPSTGTTGAPLAPDGTAAKTLQAVGFRIVDTEVLKNGDVFTIAGCFAVNPVSGESTGQLRQFVVTADASCAATAAATSVTLFVEPALMATGPYKTIDTFPAAGAAVTVVGNEAEPYPQNLAFHKNAFALVMVPLVKPDGTWGSVATDNGFSIRVVKDYDIDDDQEIIRLDVLYGVKTLYPELACRIMGAEG